MKSFIVFALLLVLVSACSSSKYVRITKEGEEKVIISQKSFGMDRKDVAISLETGEKKANIGIGDSNSTNGIQKSIDLLEAAKDINP